MLAVIIASLICSTYLFICAMHYEIVNETENVPAFIELESMLQSFDIIIVYIVYFFNWPHWIVFPEMLLFYVLNGRHCRASNSLGSQPLDATDDLPSLWQPKVLRGSTASEGAELELYVGSQVPDAGCQDGDKQESWAGEDLNAGLRKGVGCRAFSLRRAVTFLNTSSLAFPTC